MDPVAPTHANEIVRNSAMNLGFVMAFSPLALGSVEQEAAHGEVSAVTSPRSLPHSNGPEPRTSLNFHGQVFGPSDDAPPPGIPLFSETVASFLEFFRPRTGL